MDILPTITAQMASLGLPLYAFTLSAVPRPASPLLLILHWHGFRTAPRPGYPADTWPSQPIPATALQIDCDWRHPEDIDAAMLDAAWQLGAWDIERTRSRACNHIGVPEREALACRQSFAEHPLAKPEAAWVTEAPDRAALMHFAATRGYLRWQFRPVRGGLWQSLADDATLGDDGGRAPPCPVRPRVNQAGRVVYRLGRASHLIIPGAR